MVVNQEYTSQDHAFRGSDPYAHAKYRITAEWLKDSRYSRLAEVLNFGCGTDAFRVYAEQRGFIVKSYDPAFHDYPNPYLTENFDATVLHDVLEHVNVDHGFLKTVESHQVILSVPAYPWLFGLHDEQLGHYRRYTRDSLIALVEQTPYRIVRMRYFGASLIPAAFLYSRVLRRPYPLAGATGGVMGKLLKALMWAESHVPLPFGISILAELERI